MTNTIKVICFDADDTLWVNEPHFQTAEKDFLDLVQQYGKEEDISKLLHATNIANLPYYGYGSRSFILSLIETALKISDQQIDQQRIGEILNLGKRLLTHPIQLFDGVETVLENLFGRYRLIIATKGDLLEQEQKLQKSGIEHFFHHIEIMSEKNEAGYNKLLQHLDILAEEFLMIGNSLKSDIIPVLNIGGHGVHIPFHTVWFYDHVEKEIDHPRFQLVASILEILDRY